MRYKVTLLFLLFSPFYFAQINYGTPPADFIPEKLTAYKTLIEVMHFPKENDPIKAKEIVENMCSKLLANLVIENYKIIETQ